MKTFFSFSLVLIASIFLVGCSGENVSQEGPSETIPPQATQLVPENQRAQEDADFPRYTMDDINDHDEKDDCWTVIDGDVVDITSFFGIHPGGDANLLKACGKDATEMFESVKKHDPKGYEKAKELKIGEYVVDDGVEADSEEREEE
jgi:cytochrome b involved in lipid metabolism